MPKSATGQTGQAARTTVEIQKWRKSKESSWNPSLEGGNLYVRPLLCPAVFGIVQVTRTNLTYLHWNWLTNQDINDDWLCLEPLVFGSWERTSYCNDTCGSHRNYLQTRSCTPSGPGFVCDESDTLGISDIPCDPFVPCLGEHLP